MFCRRCARKHTPATRRSPTDKWEQTDWGWHRIPRSNCHPSRTCARALLPHCSRGTKHQPGRKHRRPNTRSSYRSERRSCRSSSRQCTSLSPWRLRRTSCPSSRERTCRPSSSCPPGPFPRACRGNHRCTGSHASPCTHRRNGCTTRQFRPHRGCTCGYGSAFPRMLSRRRTSRTSHCSCRSPPAESRLAACRHRARTRRFR